MTLNISTEEIWDWPALSITNTCCSSDTGNSIAEWIIKTFHSSEEIVELGSLNFII